MAAGCNKAVLPLPEILAAAASRPLLCSTPPSCFTPASKRKKTWRSTAGIAVAARLGGEDPDSFLHAALTATASLRYQETLRPALRVSNFEVKNASAPYSGSPYHIKLYERGRKNCFVPFALPETATSIVVVAMAMGLGATLLMRTKKAPEVIDSSSKICEDCGGSGICAECNGEGFVLKKMSEESAEKARMASKNMATRYTAGLPKKWSYCSKCSSARSCSTCKGSGQLI